MQKKLFQELTPTSPKYRCYFILQNEMINIIIIIIIIIFL